MGKVKVIKLLGCSVIDYHSAKVANLPNKEKKLSNKVIFASRSPAKSLLLDNFDEKGAVATLVLDNPFQL